MPAGQLSVTDALTLLDSLAKQAQNIQESGFNANATGFTNNEATIIATSDIGIFSDLASAFRQAIVSSFSPQFASRIGALDRNLKGINTFLTANDVRVHRFIRDYIKYNLLASNTFPEVALAGASRMARFVVSGSGAGTFTHTTDVDKTKYGKAWILIRNTASGNVGGADIVATIVGLKYDGTAQSKVVTMPSGSVTGTAVDVGTLGVSGDNYQQITNITITGGTAGDQIDVESRVERSISL